MAEQEYAYNGSEPYCRCCGSRKVMTLDLYIAKSDYSGQRSRLKMERALRAIDELDDGELTEFVADAVAGLNVDDMVEAECGLYSHFLCAAHHLVGYRQKAQQTDPVELSEISEHETDELLQERKFAFLRLWESFDQKSKASFLRRSAENKSITKGVRA